MHIGDVPNTDASGARVRPSPAAGRASRLLRPPRAGDLLLLHAALDPAEQATAHWVAWRGGLRGRAVDRGAERLLPLVWWNMGGPDAAEPAVLELAAAYHASWSRLQEQAAAAERVIAALQAEGIRVLLLKGLALALCSYERPALRPMADVDVLVAPADRAGAAAVLERLGFHPGRRLGPGELAAMHSLGFAGAAGAAVDLHWFALQECCYPGADEMLWEDAARCVVGAVETLAPAPAGMLLTAVAHGIRWNPEPAGRWAADALTVLRRRAALVDWARLRLEARRRGLPLLLAAALSWLAKELAAPVPPAVVAELAEDGAAWAERAELWARQGPPSLSRAVAIRWCAHARRARAGVEDPGFRGFLGYLRRAWGVEGGAALPAAVLRRGLAKVLHRGRETAAP